MARDSFLLDSTRPTAIAPATPTIAHVQLRDLLICPREQGLLNYVTHRGIVEQDINSPKSPPRTLASLEFTPISLTSLQLGSGTLIAAGGQEAEIYLSYHTPALASSVAGTAERRRSRTRVHWEYDDGLTGSINNSVLLTSLSLTRSNESSVEPRVGISNNDGTVRLYDIPLNVPKSRRKLNEVGQVRLDVPVNHSSISPDGRTLLSVGDSSKIYFHQITGGSHISFQPITTLNIPAPDTSSSFYSSSSSHVPYSSSHTSLAAAFSTAFSGDGSKFAVASQEGVVAVWDVRSTKPVRVFHMNKMRGGLGNGPGNGGATGWLSDDPWEWTRGSKAPGWCVRSVKFNGGEGSRLGKEVMAFTEHTSLIHIVDARTFETCDSVNVPALPFVNGQHTRNSSQRRGPTSNSSPSLRALAARFREARRMAGMSIEAFPLTRPELLESLRREGESTRNTGSAAQDGNALSRRLPVSNARERRYSPTPLSTRRALRRALDRSVTSPAVTSPAVLAPDTPAGISAGLSPASAAHFAMSAAARDMQAREATTLTSSLSSLPPSSTTANAAVATTPRTGSTRTPAIVQALGDAFRIPLPVSLSSRSHSNGSGSGGSGSVYSAPASIGDSTWRTLSGTHAVGAVPLARIASDGAGSGPRASSGSSTSFGDYRWDATRRVWERGQEEGTAADDHESGEGIVVVPDLGDRDVESEVHALLAVHGIESRLGSQTDSIERTTSGDTETSAGAETALEYDAYLRTLGEGNGSGNEGEGERHRGSETEDYHAWFLRALGALGDGSAAFGDAIGAARRMYEEEHVDRQTRMDVDIDDDDGEEDARMAIERDEEELHEDDDDDEQDEDEDAESECASRSGSPFASAYQSHINHRTFPFSSISSAPWSARRYGSHARTSSSTHSVKRQHSHSVGAYKCFDDLDIAGLCFDPWGEKMYAAGVGMGADFSFDADPSDSGHGAGAVVEWTVRGADKRWWVDEGWM